MYEDSQPTIVEREVADLLVDLARAEVVAPDMEQFFVHRPRAELRHLPKISIAMLALYNHKSSEGVETYPNVPSSEYLTPMSASSDCAAARGSSSAVGVASRNSARMGMSNSRTPQAMNRLRSTLLRLPIGLSYVAVSVKSGKDSAICQHCHLHRQMRRHIS